MGYQYVATAAVADVWDGPNKNERETQVLFGDQVTPISEGDLWVYGRLADGYKGYVEKQYLSLETKTGQRHATVVAPRALIAGCRKASHISYEVFMGTHLTVVRDEGTMVQVALPWGEAGLVRTTDIAWNGPDRPVPGLAQARDSAVKYAFCLIGAPYLWGGLTCRGFDCSGLVQVVYRSAGYLLPRNADQQHRALQAVVDGPLIGDLAFFGGEQPGLVSHVGLCLDDKTFIHASQRLGGVVVTSLSSPFYKERLLGWRRLC